MDVAVFFVGTVSGRERALIDYITARYSLAPFSLTSVDRAKAIAAPKEYANELRAEHAKQLESVLATVKRERPSAVCVYPIYFPNVLEALKRRSCFYLFVADSSHQTHIEHLESDFDNYLSLSRAFAAAFDTRVLRSHAHCIFQLGALTETALNATVAGCVLGRVLEARGSLFDVGEHLMTLAMCTRRRSNCARAAVGCVFARETEVLTIAYNGTPHGARNCLDGGCRACAAGDGGSDCRCVHAMVNALLNVGSRAVGGGDAYLTMLPCLNCFVHAVNAGVARLFVPRNAETENGAPPPNYFDVSPRPIVVFVDETRPFGVFEMFALHAERSE